MDVLDSFDLNCSSMDLDPDPAPARPAPPRFQPKLKGKIKAQLPPNQDLEPVPCQKSGQSGSNSLAIPTPVDADAKDDDDPVVREINMFWSPLDDDAQVKFCS